MKNRKISLSWKASRKKNKQRKYLIMAPLSSRHKMISAHLSKELRQKYKRRSLTLRKGDTVKIMIGEFRGKNGKIAVIDHKNYKVYIEGIQRSKKEGAKINVPIHPSNLQIIALSLEDKKRNEKLNKKTGEK